MANWTTAAGVTLKITDMVDRHLLSTIVLLRQTADKRLLEHELSCIASVGSVNGEMAQYSLEQAAWELGRTDPLNHLVDTEPRYMIMLREAERRGFDVAALLEEAQLKDNDGDGSKEIPF